MPANEQLSVEERLTRLEDYEKIKVLITGFARGADANCDPSLLRPLFTDDAIFDVGQFGRLEGGDNIVKEMHANVEIGFNNTLHFLVSPTIDMGADLRSAKCFYYLWETANHQTKSGENIAYWIGGWYDAEVIKLGSEWRFRHLNLTLKLLSPYAEGWHALPHSFDDLG